eukprot:6214071-Pleurochrysis_carterae.AAC.4
MPYAAAILGERRLGVLGGEGGGEGGAMCVPASTSPAGLLLREPARGRCPSLPPPHALLMLPAPMPGPLGTRRSRALPAPSDVQVCGAACVTTAKMPSAN